MYATNLTFFSTIIFINTIILPYRASSCVLQSLTLTVVFKGKSIQREWVIIWNNPISNKQTISPTRSSKGKSMSFPRYIFFEIKLMWYFFNNIAIVYSFGNYLWRLFSEPVATEKLHLGNENYACLPKSFIHLLGRVKVNFRYSLASISQK